MNTVTLNMPKTEQAQVLTDVCFLCSAAENLITIVQARDGLSVQSQSSPLQGPECCSYNSHGSSIQESPSERESQINNTLQI